MFKQGEIKVFLRQAVPPLLLYLMAASTIYLGNKIAPSNMCNPGLDVLFFFLLLIINLVLSVRCIAQDWADHTLKASTVMHLAVGLFIWSSFFL
jgi:hypothetical protein